MTEQPTLHKVAERLQGVAAARAHLDVCLGAWEAQAVRIPPPSSSDELARLEQAATKAQSAWSGYAGQLARFARFGLPDEQAAR